MSGFLLHSVIFEFTLLQQGAVPSNLGELVDAHARGLSLIDFSPLK